MIHLTRRETLGMLAWGATGYVATAAFTAPACGISKEKAVRIIDFSISLAREAVPLLNLIGAQDIAGLFETKAVPTLEKLKDALVKTDIPTAGSIFDTVRSVLGGIETALFNLPDSARRTTVLGILASMKMLLLTVRAFIESETPASSMPTMASTGISTAEAIRKALEATRL